MTHSTHHTIGDIRLTMKETNLGSSYDLILKNVNRFVYLTPAEQETYISLLSKRTVKKKTFLLREGDTIAHEFFVTKGCLKVYTLNDKGVEHISMFAIEDWWTGDILSFINQQPSKYFIEALEDSEVIQISKNNYDLLFEHIPKFERFYRVLYQRSLISYIQRTNQSIALSAEERYTNFTKKYPSLVNRVSQKNIAAYLGVTPEFLSVLRKKLNII